MPTKDEGQKGQPPERRDEEGTTVSGDAGVRPDPDDTDFGDDDFTPATASFAPLSGTALNLFDVALALQSLVESVRETARQYDRTEGVARKHLAAEASKRLIAVGGDVVAAGVSLSEEASRP